MNGVRPPTSAGGFIKACRWGAIIGFGVAYSVLSHLAAESTTPGLLGALLAITPLIALAAAIAWRSPHRAFLLGLCLAACALLFAMREWLIGHYNWVFLLQHAGMYALLCLAFGRTLLAGKKPMIAGFAEIVHGKLSPALQRYTRGATWAWTIYFAATAAGSLLLFWLASISAWSTFANLLGIPLLVLMFAGEYAVRCLVLPIEDRAGPIEAIRAYRQASRKSPSAP